MITRSKELESRYTYAYYYLARVYLATEDKSKVLEVYHKGLKIDPNFKLLNSLFLKKEED